MQEGGESENKKEAIEHYKQDPGLNTLNAHSSENVSNNIPIKPGEQQLDDKDDISPKNH